jgi:hypothetical protein
MNLDLFFHACEAVAILPLAWKLNRVLNRYGPQLSVPNPN